MYLQANQLQSNVEIQGHSIVHSEWEFSRTQTQTDSDGSHLPQQNMAKACLNIIDTRRLSIYITIILKVKCTEFIGLKL